MTFIFLRKYISFIFWNSLKRLTVELLLPEKPFGVSTSQHGWCEYGPSNRVGLGQNNHILEEKKMYSVRVSQKNVFRTSS